MATTRRAAGESAVITTPYAGDDNTFAGGDEVVGGADRRDSALAALLVSPAATPIMVDPAPPQKVKPEGTGTVCAWEPGGVRYLVWADVYARMFGEDRRSARKGDIVVVPDDAVTASHVRLGHLIPE